MVREQPRATLYLLPTVTQLRVIPPLPSHVNTPTQMINIITPCSGRLPKPFSSRRAQLVVCNATSCKIAIFNSFRFLYVSIHLHTKMGIRICIGGGDTHVCTTVPIFGAAGCHLQTTKNRFVDLCTIRRCAWGFLTVIIYHTCCRYQLRHLAAAGYDLSVRSS